VTNQAEVVMARRKRPYTEGDWIAVPLTGGGFAVGVVARANRKGGLLGYFFGSRYQTLPSVASVAGHRAEDAILVRIFGDLGLIDGRWPVLGKAGA